MGILKIVSESTTISNLELENLLQEISINCTQERSRFQFVASLSENVYRLENYLQEIR